MKTFATTDKLTLPCSILCATRCSFLYKLLICISFCLLISLINYLLTLETSFLEPPRRAHISIAFNVLKDISVLYTLNVISIFAIFAYSFCWFLPTIQCFYFISAHKINRWDKLNSSKFPNGVFVFQAVFVWNVNKEFNWKWVCLLAWIGGCLQLNYFVFRFLCILFVDLAACERVRNYWVLRMWIYEQKIIIIGYRMRHLNASA